MDKKIKLEIYMNSGQILSFKLTSEEYNDFFNTVCPTGVSMHTPKWVRIENTSICIDAISNFSYIEIPVKGKKTDD